METEDNWLYDSVKMYKHLHMYDLQQPCVAMDWIDGKSLCISTCGDRKPEILELVLPDKLVSEQNAGLTKDRDFKIASGGFCDRPISCVRHIKDSRNVVTAERDDNSVSVWWLGDSNSDLIKKSKVLKNQNTRRCTAQIDVDSAHATYGSHMNNICKADIDTGQVVWSTSNVCTDEEKLSRIVGMDSNNLAVCSESSGNISVIDSRLKSPVASCHKCLAREAKYWTMCTQSQTATPSTLLIRLSSEGEITVMDCRNFDAETAYQTSHRAEGLGDSISVSASQIDCHLVSISGFDGHVYVYNLKKECDMKPDFIHQGHVACSDQSEPGTLIARHLWYPLRQNLIISTANDGSLHAWEYIL